MRYPIDKATDIPGSGSAVYLYLLDMIDIPSRCPHDIWYAGQKKKLDNPHDPFKGFPPVGKTYKLDYANSGMKLYTFTGKEQNAIYVKDLSSEARLELGIPADANPADKVFNPNFITFDELPHSTKVSNQATTMSLAKSISAFLCNKKSILYTEQDIVDLLTVAIKKVDSAEMMMILHGNHVAWCSLAFMRTGKMEEDIRRQFYGQNNIDFYVKDIGTIMPSVLYTLAILGADPVEILKDFQLDIYGIENTAVKMQGYMKIHQEAVKAA
jgi:hypothetical protein